MLSGLKLYNGYNILDVLTPGTVIEGSKFFSSIPGIQKDKSYQVVQIQDKETGLISYDYKEVDIIKEPEVNIPNVIVNDEPIIPNYITPDPFIYKIKKRHQSFTSLDAIATYTTIILIVYGSYKIYNSIN